MIWVLVLVVTYAASAVALGKIMSGNTRIDAMIAGEEERRTACNSSSPVCPTCGFPQEECDLLVEAAGGLR